MTGDISRTEARKRKEMQERRTRHVNTHTRGQLVTLPTESKQDGDRVYNVTLICKKEVESTLLSD